MIKNNALKIWILTLAIWMLLVPMVSADAVVGDVVVTLGESLSQEQKEAILKEMNVKEDEVEIIYVTNEEEHHYLGDYIPAHIIQYKTYSCSMITMQKKGKGINVETNNITWVSEGMYANALITAGIKDADVYVTAPFAVSGTGALTGLIKAYEASTDEVIPEEQKQIANEELVRTAEIGEEYGIEKATELMARIKEAIAEENIKTEADLRELIQRIANELGITLTDIELDGLVSLFNRMKNLNIDWDQVKSQIDKVRDNITEFVNSEEGKGFIRTILDFISTLIDVIKGWFTSTTIITPMK